jgi:hypothetical protein
VTDRYAAPEEPAAHPLYQTWVMLLNGYGYNWYRRDNALRADDLLIRSRADEHLAAATGLRDFESAFARRYLPPPSREHPDPDPARLAEMRRVRAAADRIREVATRLRGAAVPPDDKVWERHRSAVDTLKALAEFDTMLVGAAAELSRLTAALSPATGFDAATEAGLDQRLADLDAALRRRRELLGGPG